MTEVFLCRGKRSPVGRHGGALARLRPDDMAAQVIDGLLGADDLPVDEVILGCANQAGEDNRNVARMAILLSRLPVTVPGLTVNRLCASGLDAVIAGARAIATGGADLVIGAGGAQAAGRLPPLGADGCHLTCRKTATGHLIAADSRGQARLFLYADRGRWAVHWRPARCCGGAATSLACCSIAWPAASKPVPTSSTSGAKVSSIPSAR